MTEQIWDSIKEQSRELSLKKLTEQVIEITKTAMDHNYIAASDNDELTEVVIGFIEQLNKKLVDTLQGSINSQVYDITIHALENKLIKNAKNSEAVTEIANFVIKLDDELIDHN